MFLFVIEVLFRLFQVISYSVTLYELFKHTFVPFWHTLREFREGRRDTTTTSRVWFKSGNNLPTTNADVSLSPVTARGFRLGGGSGVVVPRTPRLA